MGDWNSKVGSNRIHNVTGGFGLGNQNEAGKRMIDFCLENELTIANTFFMQPKRRLYTWTSPDGQHRNQIDYITIANRWKSHIHSTKTFPGADCGTDHELLVFKIKVKLKSKKKQLTQPKFDLEKIPPIYAIEVKNKFKNLDFTNQIPEEIWVQKR